MTKPYFYMLPLRFKSLLRDTRGYTLVETLMASAIFLGVLVPACLLAGRLALSRHSHEVLIATQLAQTEMERTLAGALYDDEEKLVAFDQKNWRLKREIERRDDLIIIRVLVFRGARAQALLTLQTLRVAW